MLVKLTPDLCHLKNAGGSIGMGTRCGGNVLTDFHRLKLETLKTSLYSEVERESITVQMKDCTYIRNYIENTKIVRFFFLKYFFGVTCPFWLSLLFLFFSAIKWSILSI
jgi:hypothetical protein